MTLMGMYICPPARTAVRAVNDSPQSAAQHSIDDAANAREHVRIVYVDMREVFSASVVTSVGQTIEPTRKHVLNNARISHDCCHVDCNNAGCIVQLIRAMVAGP